jgi:hypothetical protein
LTVEVIVAGALQQIEETEKRRREEEEERETKRRQGRCLGCVLCMMRTDDG